MDENKTQQLFDQLACDHPQAAQQMKLLWQQVLQALRGMVSEVAISTWMQEMIPACVADGTVTVYTVNQFQLDVVQNRYLKELESAFSQVLGFPCAVRFIQTKEQLYDVTQPQNQKKPALSNSFRHYTFSNFIVGSSNRFAHAAAMAVAQNPAHAYNPLFIYGDSGLGKTHLLNAIMDEIKKSFPNFKVVYLKGDDFTNELIAAIQQGQASRENFRTKYRYADMLLVDDIQFIAGKDASQEEFFHTFNALHEASKQIVLTSDRPPKDILTLEERLRSRFEWGIIADISAPDYETRVAIIKEKMESLGIALDEEIVTLVANSIKTNIRQLEGAVKKLEAYQRLNQTKITAEMAQDAIRDLSQESAPALTPEFIIAQVANFYNKPVSDLLGPKKTRELTLPRQIAMYIVRELNGLSLPAIGAQFGGRDHTTVLYSIRQIEAEVSRNARLKNTVFDLMKNINNPTS